MFDPFTWLLVGPLVALIWNAWDDIREWIAASLRSLGLEDTPLMDALLVIDRLRSGVRVLFKVRLEDRKRFRRVDEAVYEMDELPEDIRKELEERRRVTMDVLPLITED